jgi:DNA-binding MarR family transcriptional regulator
MKDQNINIGREINRFLNRINKHINHAVSGYGITGPQAHIINFIYDRSSESAVLQRDIEKEFEIRRSSTTNALHILEKRGLITRRGVDNDARLKEVILTKEGMKIQKIVSKIIYESDQALRESLTKEEFALLIKITSKLPSVYESNLKIKWKATDKR